MGGTVAERTWMEYCLHCKLRVLGNILAIAHREAELETVVSDVPLSRTLIMMVEQTT